MKACVLAVLLLVGGICLAQASPGEGNNPAAYPEPEATAAWRALAASYIRKALKDQTLDQDPALNARIDTVMATVGAAAAAIDARFANVTWRAVLIADFGRGAVAFPGEIILVDAKFVRALQLDDDELAFVLAHEVAHVVAGNALAKLSFMAKILGKEKIPTARTALLEYLAKDSYANDFLPIALQQEREADSLGAAVFFATGYEADRAVKIFDKLAQREAPVEENAASHDAAMTRKQAFTAALAELQALHARRATAFR
jgi:predicted Zn-dependent protease